MNILSKNAKPQDVRIDIVDVTPEQASHWLEHCNTRNRKASKPIVKAYAEDMANNRWEFTSQGISFYKDGTLADGQHRLMAIVESGKTVKMIITYGLSQSAINGIDQHKIRSVHDVLTLKQEYGRVEGIDVATLRLCYYKQKVNTSLAERMLEENIVELKKVREMFGSQSTKVGSALFRAAILLALKDGQSEEVLKDFVQVLMSGVTEKPQHRTVILLRDATLRGDFKGGGDAVRRQHLKLIQRVIQRFIRGEVAKRMPIVPDYYTFPLLSINDLNEENNEK